MLNRNLLSDRYTDGRWVTFNRTRLLSLALENLDANASIVLDLGCGEGKYLPLLLKGLPNCHFVIGIDISPEYIKKAKIKNPRENIDFLIADGQNLPFKEKCFGLILSKDMLHHVRHPGQVLREIDRVSKGQIVIIEANKHNPIMLLNEKYGKHQHLTIQQLELLARSYLDTPFFSLEAHEYPFTLRLPSLSPMAFVWNLLVSLSLIACNQIPFLAEFLYKTLSFLLVPSYYVLIMTEVSTPTRSSAKRSSYKLKNETPSD